MNVRDKVSLYKARYQKWRSEPGTEEWYRAIAKIREYHGDKIGAMLARGIAAFRRVLKDAVNQFAKAIENFNGVTI